MTKRQLIFGVIAIIAVVTIAGIVAWTNVQSYEKEMEINSQKAIENAKIEAEKDIETAKIREGAKLERTKERLNWIPWYNKDEEDGDKAD